MRYPNFDWNYFNIYNNPNFNNYIIEYFKNNQINYFEVCKNIELTEFNLKFLDNKINWNGISLNDKLNESFIDKYKNFINFDSVCKNENISFEYLIKNIDKIKLMYNITNSPNLNIYYYEKYKNQLLFNNYQLFTPLKF